MHTQRSITIPATVCLLTVLGPCALLSADESALTVTTAMEEFLHRFDAIAARGFIRTSRAGDTGVGHTLESLLGLAENNRRTADFRGIEIKARRVDPDHPGRHRPMNLFLKEPEWIDPEPASARIRRFGYIDRKSRPAWYQSVTSRENSGGLKLQPDDRARTLLLLDSADAIGGWSYDVLEQRLGEKHSEAVFVAAEARGRGRSEEFHYHSVLWCRRPSLERFLNIASDGDIVVELRMHVTAAGQARNHGTAFRIRANRLQDLYALRTQLRPKLPTERTDQ